METVERARSEDILVGGIATNLQGYLRYTGDMDLLFDDTPKNRKRLREAYKAYSKINFEAFETIQFVPGWTDFPLNNGSKLNVMTAMKGVDATFDDCWAVADRYNVSGVCVPVLHINHLIANKKAVGRPKDQLDAIKLAQIKKLRGEEN